MDGWALLATTAPRSYHSPQLRSRLWEELAGLLQAGCADLRVSAGEALALVVEHWREAQGVEEGGALELPEGEDAAVDAAVDRLQELAKEGSKRMRWVKRVICRSTGDCFAVLLMSLTPPCAPMHYPPQPAGQEGAAGLVPGDLRRRGVGGDARRGA